jgi:hypothetical protein
VNVDTGSLRKRPNQGESQQKEGLRQDLD